MTKKLECVTCNKDLGTIKSGSVSQGLKPCCTSCFNKMQNAVEMLALHRLKGNDDTSKSFKNSDIFGDIFK